MRGHKSPRQDELLALLEVCVVVEALEGDPLGGKGERSPPEVELTLLERHEARSGEESATTKKNTRPMHELTRHGLLKQQ